MGERAMKREAPILLLTVLVLLPLSVAASPSDSFISTASLFTIGTGARPVGMGNAFVGLADDGNALSYNPAGLAFVEKAGVTSFYSSQYSTLSHGSVLYSQPNLGLGYLQLSSGELTEMDLYGNSTGKFDYTSRGLIGAITTQIDNLALALQGKIFSAGSAKSALGYSLSPSFLYKVGSFQFGGILKNLVSTDISYTDQYTEPWEKELTLGIAYLNDGIKMDLDIDALLTNKGIDPNVARAGAEMELFHPVSARLGINSKMQSSLGLSVEFKRFQFDYAYSFHQELPTTHRISLTATFRGLPEIALQDLFKDKFIL